LCNKIDDLESMSEAVTLDEGEVDSVEIEEGVTEGANLDFSGRRILVVGGRLSLDALKIKHQTEDVVFVQCGEYSKLLKTPPTVDHVVFYRRPNSHAMYEIVKNQYGRKIVTVV